MPEFEEYLKEGYKESTSSPLPAPPGWEDTLKSYQKLLNKEYAMLEEDMNHIMGVRKNAMAVFLLLGAAVGGLFGCILGAACCGGGGKKKSKTD